MSMTQEKMQKQCEVGYRITKIIWCFYFIFVAACIIYGIMVMCLPEASFALETVGGKQMIMNRHTVIFIANEFSFVGEVTSLKTAQLMTLLGKMIGVLLPWGFILYWVKDTFYNFAYGESPFQKESADNIKKISYVILISSVLSTFVSELLVGLFAMEHPAIHMQIEIGGILVAGLIYICGAILEYACKLQNDHDETL